MLLVIQCRIQVVYLLYEGTCGKIERFHESHHAPCFRNHEIACAPMGRHDRIPYSLNTFVRQVDQSTD